MIRLQTSVDLDRSRYMGDDFRYHSFRMLAIATIRQAAIEARKNDLDGSRARTWLLLTGCRWMCLLNTWDIDEDLLVDKFTQWVLNGCPNNGSGFIRTYRPNAERTN